ncbi:DUF4260 family protein [uncultured Dokdonia sp.]
MKKRKELPLRYNRILGYGLKYEKGFKFTHLGDL